MIKPHEAIALFDLDGTLADFDGRMREQLQLLRSPDEQPVDVPDLFETGTTPAWLEARKALIKKQPVPGPRRLNGASGKSPTAWSPSA